MTKHILHPQVHFTLNLKNGKGQKLRRNIGVHGELVIFNFHFRKIEKRGDCSWAGRHTITLELQAELREVAAEVAQHDAEREAELSSHRSAVASLRRQVHEARSHLAGAREVVVSLEARLEQERLSHLRDKQVILAHVAPTTREDRGSGEALAAPADAQTAEPGGVAQVSLLRTELLKATARAERKRELLAESEAEGRQLTEFLKELFEAQADVSQRASTAQPSLSEAEAAAPQDPSCDLIRGELDSQRWKCDGSAIEDSAAALRLAELRAELPSLQAEAKDRAIEAECLRRQAAEGHQRALEAEERLRRQATG